MKQIPLLIFLLSLALVSLACEGGTALPATLEPATVASVSPVPKGSPVSPKGVGTRIPVPTTQPPFFSGLMVAYIRGSNLWFWSDANGPHVWLVYFCNFVKGKCYVIILNGDITYTFCTLHKIMYACY